MTTFARARIDDLPPYLRGPEGVAFATALGGEQDAELARLRVALLSRSPGRCPDDALGTVGSTYQIRQAPWETAAAYRLRLADPFAFWEMAPRTSGLAAVIAPMNTNGQITFYSDRDSEWDDAHNQIGRVWGLWDLKLAPDSPWDGDAGLYDDGGIWELYFDSDAQSGFGVAHLDYVRREIRSAKGAHAYPVAIFAGLTFDAESGEAPFWDSLGAPWDSTATEFWDEFGSPESTILLLGHMWDEDALYGGGPGCWDGDDGATWHGFEPPSGGW